MTPELYGACTRELHVVRGDGRWLRAGRAALYILERLGWGLLPQWLSLPPFIWGVEMGYRILASNRLRLSRLLHDIGPRLEPSSCAREAPR